MLGPDDLRRSEEAANAERVARETVARMAEPPAVAPVPPWSYPTGRYYDSWFGTDPPPAEREFSDGEINAVIVDRLHTNPHTQDDTIKVDVKQRVVILGGEVSSWLAKRAAGDDAWDTRGVVDVSNQLERRGRDARGRDA